MSRARTLTLVIAIALLAGWSAYFLLNRRTPQPPAMGIAVSLAESRAARVSALQGAG